MAGGSAAWLSLPDAEVTYDPAFLSPDQATRLFEELRATTAWRQERIRIHGRVVDVPRLTAWHGDEGAEYVYSGLVNRPAPWTAALLEVKRAAEEASGAELNCVLANWYRTGRDSVSWHSDDEPELGECPVIASVSLGGTRTFQMKHKARPQLRASLALTHGSLLVMRGPTQHHWLHQVPKTRREVAERINLTYRLIRLRANRGGG
jgi:alkylated DNA repair dioxygenase AlkB